LDPGGFANPIAQIVEFRPAYFTTTDDLDIGNPGRVEQENSFYSHTLEDFAYCNRFVDTAMAFGDDNTLVGLNPLFISFDDSHPYPDRVTDMDNGQIALEILGFD
jgi:hypothetical protein